MKHYLKKFISISALLIVMSLIYLRTNDSIGFNKTALWAWDISNIDIWIIVITYVLLLLLMISVVALLILKLRDNLRGNTK